MTNNQILLKEIIKQECQNSSEYNNENSYFEFFAANQVLKDYEFSNEEIENPHIRTHLIHRQTIR